jgi:hypothetical protein
MDCFYAVRPSRWTGPDLGSLSCPDCSPDRTMSNTGWQYPGRAGTLELVSQSFYWPYQRKYVNRFVGTDDTLRAITNITRLIYQAPDDTVPLRVPQ